MLYNIRTEGIFVENETPVKRENRRTKYTKSVLKDSLLHFIKEKPVKDITITELCEYADVNRGTFYNYYSDVQSLLESIENDFLAGIFNVASELSLTNRFFDRDGDKAPLNREALREFLVGILGYLYTEKEMCRLITQNDAGTGFLVKIIHSVSDFYVLAWQANVDTEQRSDDMLFLKTFVKYIVGGIVGMISDWIQDDMRLSPAEMTELIIRVVEADAYEKEN